MFLSSVLTNSDVRVRINEGLEQSICKLSGVEKLAKALPNLEVAVKMITEINEDIKRGCKFYEKGSDGELMVVDFNIVPVLVKGPALVRIRITKELEDDIYKLAESLGFSVENGEEITFSDALPYLQAAVNVASQLRLSNSTGSSFYMMEPDGEKYIVKLN